MSDLNVTPARIERPASEFPERANVYFCDDCKRDITSHFSPGHSHSWRPMGPERYTCECGRRYLTGAVEWDHLSDWERSRRISETLGLGILLSVMLAVPVLMFCGLFAWIFHWKAALLIAGIVIPIPFIVMQIMFWPEVAASKRRTR